MGSNSLRTFVAMAGAAASITFAPGCKETFPGDTGNSCSIYNSPEEAAAARAAALKRREEARIAEQKRIEEEHLQDCRDLSANIFRSLYMGKMEAKHGGNQCRRAFDNLMPGVIDTRKFIDSCSDTPIATLAERMKKRVVQAATAFSTNCIKTE